MSTHSCCLNISLKLLVIAWLNSVIDEHAPNASFLRKYIFSQEENAYETLEVPKWKILTADYFVARTTTYCARCTFAIDLFRWKGGRFDEKLSKVSSQTRNRRLCYVILSIWIMCWVRKKVSNDFQKANLNAWWFLSSSK